MNTQKIPQTIGAIDESISLHKQAVELLEKLKCGLERKALEAERPPLKYTRKQYMDKEVSHAEYYGQFVTPRIKALVIEKIGLERLLASTDARLNDIGMKLWDSVTTGKTLKELRWDFGGPGVTLPIFQTPGDNSMSAGTCIVKQAARQIIAEHKTQTPIV